MLRIVVRRLLPEVLLEPLAKLYRGLSRYGAMTGRLRGVDLRSAARVARSLWKLGYRFARSRFARGWHGVAPHRHLLAAPAKALTYPKRVQKAVLAAFLALPDPRYRRRLARFGARLSEISCTSDRRPRSGVAMVIGALGPGGAERQTVLTLLGLAKRGYGPLSMRCQFLRNDAERFFAPQLEEAGISVGLLAEDPGPDSSLLDEPAMAAVRNLPESLQETIRYIRTFEELRPEVVHLWLDEVNIKGGLAAVVTGVPRIVLGMRSQPPLNFVFHQPYMREGYRWLARQPGVIMLNNSAAGARAYERWLRLPRGTIHVVHNGFDFSASILARHSAERQAYRTRYSLPKAAVVIGTVIRFSEEKRPLLWLEIAACIRRKRPDLRFLLVGDGVMRDAVYERASRDDLRGAVELVGHERHALTAIAAMDIFLLTSRLEGLPNVLVEAQAMGVPVVATNVGGSSETVRHGVTGWILERDDPQHVADTLVRLVGDTAWLKNASRECSVFVRDSFGVDRMLDETLSIYDRSRKA